MAENVKVIEIKKGILDDNKKLADAIRRRLNEKEVFLLNLMSSPGSGKTSLLVKSLELLKEKFNIAVIEADIDSDVDAKTIKSLGGVEAIQLHTGGMCHMDATATVQGLDQLDLDNLDLIVVENIGNLVCPASFDIGADLDMMILSVPEGDDKALKYPKMFQITDLVVINKIDVIEYFDFNLDLCKERILDRNPKSKIFPLSAKTGQGLEAFVQFLAQAIENKKK